MTLIDAIFKAAPAQAQPSKELFWWYCCFCFSGIDEIVCVTELENVKVPYCSK
jgi:hypothetical protein